MNHLIVFIGIHQKKRSVLHRQGFMMNSVYFKHQQVVNKIHVNSSFSPLHNERNLISPTSLYLLSLFQSKPSLFQNSLFTYAQVLREVFTFINTINNL